eukprot:5958211-Ditylum_brightwellii.AAC.1
MAAGTSNNIEDGDTGYIGAHKEIERRGHINQSNLIESSFVESNIILDNDSDDCPEETDDQMPSSSQPTVNLDNFPSIIKILKDGITGQLSSDYKEVTKILIDHGAGRNLFFFLSRAGGSGKSHDSIYLAAVSGTAAALLGGGTLHAVAGLNRTNIPQDMVNYWKMIKGVCDVYYGGVPIDLAGDFHQLCPCGGIPVYKNS